MDPQIARFEARVAVGEALFAGAQPERDRQALLNDRQLAAVRYGEAVMLRDKVSDMVESLVGEYPTVPEADDKPSVWESSLALPFNRGEMRGDVRTQPQYVVASVRRGPEGSVARARLDYYQVLPLDAKVGPRSPVQRLRLTDGTSVRALRFAREVTPSQTTLPAVPPARITTAETSRMFISGTGLDSPLHAMVQGVVRVRAELGVDLALQREAVHQQRLARLEARRRPQPSREFEAA